VTIKSKLDYQKRKPLHIYQEEKGAGGTTSLLIINNNYDISSITPFMFLLNSKNLVGGGVIK
jgi:hypothetical protein